MIDIACGSGDAQTLCVTEGGQVWSWGDGDYGKLGRGGSDGCKEPQVVDKLEGHDIIRVECGSQFSVALSKDGVLFTWYVLVLELESYPFVRYIYDSSLTCIELVTP